MDGDYEIDHGIDLLGGVLSQGRSHPVHARSGGNELNHLYVLSKDGQERDLTPGAKLKATFEGWSRDGPAFYVSTNECDPRYFDVYRYDAATYERRLLHRNEQGYFPDFVSDDEKWVALTKLNTTSDSDIYVWNAATNALTHVSTHKGEAQVSARRLRSAVEISLLPDERRQRVHAPPPRLARRRQA